MHINLAPFLFHQQLNQFFLDFLLSHMAKEYLHMTDETEPFLLFHLVDKHQKYFYKKQST